jgi:hypothetical protein
MIGPRADSDKGRVLSRAISAALTSRALPLEGHLCKASGTAACGLMPLAILSWDQACSQSNLILETLLDRSELFCGRLQIGTEGSKSAFESAPRNCHVRLSCGPSRGRTRVSTDPSASYHDGFEAPCWESSCAPVVGR